MFSIMSVVSALPASQQQANSTHYAFRADTAPPAPRRPTSFLRRFSSRSSTKSDMSTKSTSSSSMPSQPLALLPATLRNKIYRSVLHPRVQESKTLDVADVDLIEAADLVPSVQLETCRNIAETVRRLARDGQVFSEEEVVVVERWVKGLEL